MCRSIISQSKGLWGKSDLEEPKPYICSYHFSVLSSQIKFNSSHQVMDSTSVANNFEQKGN
uniref:Uncharacterized protein n=1 Tax=Rhizophora mucronata TaxID=61149 RepID=A0A2P2N604_RHIMU